MPCDTGYRPVFYLGTHKPHWLWSGEADFPLCVSYRTLRIYRTLYPATVPWILDSGGFSELAMYGRWTVSPREYVADVARYVREIGSLAWAAPQDWMCEPAIIRGGMAGKVRCAGTGLDTEEHQIRTVLNFLELTELWPQYSDDPCPFIPVVQGSGQPWPHARYAGADHIRCTWHYSQAGVRLNTYPAVGIGSVCRLQSTDGITEIGQAMRLVPRAHFFGVKTRGLLLAARDMASADSLAWSYDARRSKPLSGHTHASCSNCLPYARQWRTRLLNAA